MDEKQYQAAVAAATAAWSTPEEYWNRHLRKHNGRDLQYIGSDYPKERTITVDLKQVIDNKAWDMLFTSSSGAIVEHITTAALGLLQERDDRYPRLVVHFLNVPNQKQISELRVSDINKLISIKALVKRVTEVRPKITEAVFRCGAGHFTVVRGKYNKVAVPVRCDTQGCRFTTLDHISARDKLVNRQFIYVQESLDELKGGKQPSTLKVEMIDDLCNVLMVGDTVILNGTYRAIDRMKQGVLDSTKDVYFDCNNIEVGIREFDEVVMSEDDEKAIRAMAAHSDIFQRVEASLAPSILGMSLLKRAIALMLFEGVTKVMPDGTTHRGYLNVLCISDPGMAKTVLLRFVAGIAPRGVFANATTATSVGLIAPVIRDELTGQWAVEAGAYMLASGGVLCLDEIGEISKEDFKSLHEAMENGEVHISKAGLNVTVKTRASMLAACNPIKGRFSAYESLPSQVQIPPAVLSRFDLVVLLQDRPDEKSDRRIAQFITDSHMTAGAMMAGLEPDAELKAKLMPVIAPDLLRKYIAYARRIVPVIQPIANRKLVDYYVKIRPFTETGETVAVTTRQQPSVIRLAEAHARMRLSETVDEQDADAAISIFDACLKAVGIDPSTGKLDIDRVTNVTTAQSRGMNDAILNTIKYVGAESGAARQDAIVARMGLLGFDGQKVLKALEGLSREGRIMEPKNGVWRLL